MNRQAIASVLLGLLLVFVAGVLLRGSCFESSERTSRRSSHTPSAAQSTLEDRLDDLRAIGYADFGPDVVEEGEPSGVTAWQRDETWDGYNLYCSRLSPEAILLDMSGEIVHRWSHSTSPEGVWEHAIMLDNGDLVVIVKHMSVLRLDWHSNLIWRRKLRAHHDIALAPDGSFHVLVDDSREYRGLMIEFPAVVHLSAEGETIDRWSAFEHLAAIKEAFEQREFLDTILDRIERTGELANVIEMMGAKKYDYFHANTVTVLPDTPLGERDARFRKGNLLLCFRDVNQIFVLDASDERVVWAWGAEHLDRPHHPTMLANGRILVFDNGSKRGYSRVIELDPVNGKIVWEYAADPPESFYTAQKGSSQRLPNGNTLVGAGDSGRAFEITASGEIVWEWLNPVVEDGRRAAIYRMTRLAPELVDVLLER